jgi:phosphoglycolate phosphatase
MSTKYRLIVFDWDGTLMDSIATIVACATTAAGDVGAGDEGTPVRSRRAIGLGLDDTARHILPGASDELRAAWVERYRHLWFASFRDRPLCFEGVGRMLETLAADGYWLAVATGKSRRGLDRDLEVTGHGKFFLATRTVNEALGKPHPQMLLDILDELGVDRSEALMVGDTTFDLEMAKNAGVAAVAVLSGSHDRETLLACGPVACLEAATELPAWLEGQAS